MFQEGLYLDKSTDLPFTGNVKGLFEGFLRLVKKTVLGLSSIEKKGFI